MKAKANELIFISQINRDGSGTHPVSDDYLKTMLENPLCKNNDFNLTCLSLSEKTFIANGFNSFVVRIKEKEKCDCTHTQACELCAESKDIKWTDIFPQKTKVNIGK